MPNWCSNNFRIVGSTESLKPLWEQIDREEKFLEVIKPIGEWDYGNAVEAWGTKWDVNTDGMEFTDNGDGTAEISGWFDSAWSPPVEAFQTLSEDLDSCYLELSYFEPGMCFVGYWDSEGADDHYTIDPEAEDMGIPAYLEEEWCVSDWFRTDEDDEEVVFEDVDQDTLDNEFG
jgi:hypothetical protein